MLEEQIDFTVSRLKTGIIFLPLAWATALFMSIIYDIVVKIVREDQTTEFNIIVFIGGFLFFGTGTALIGRELFRHGNVVSISPRGIFDRRVSCDWIPWNAVCTIGSHGMIGYHSIVLRLHPNCTASVRLRRFAKLVSRINQRYVLDAYWVNSFILKGGFKPLLEAVEGASGRCVERL